MTEQKNVRPISDLDQLNVTNYYYETSPMVCSNAMLFDISSGRLTNLRVQSGCNGNLQGISRLSEGMRVDEVITRLAGISCAGRPDSCPNQLSVALRQCLEEHGYAVPDVPAPQDILSDLRDTI